MEHVFPIEINVSSPLIDINRGKAFSNFSGVKEGVIERIIKPGNFLVTFPDGLKVRVRGSDSIKLGSKVQVQFTPDRLRGAEKLVDAEKAFGPSENGFHWSALMPLGFGGRGAKSRLEVFVERQQESAWDKVAPALYFVFVVQTKELGEIQWSIHMKGRQVSIHVFAPGVLGSPEGLRTLVWEVEKGLKKKGFVLSSPTVYLNKPFKVPAGFRLNVRG